ncbi:UDP-N-acetylmuramoylalanyl-D-glutamyl-2,6-diamin opimelate/D-alanyl-D-alanyl ligase [Spirochaeta thermophila DSM 6578]|uniref:UDP-N-acetylmuramoyl-tripeptide--D-alanyl-D-alanine ligase n=1 Tax=Winmispira thermophila (strain ATCC 700085 / DSM 6578 / Z-1203) TaxID=869211 RepID=G0GCA8_WINT7|nr:UDP-N-acetylmuramoyl-tripeptide--D-alanyl-D-alanine ligase [Spirochaeta thermophila]AEJ61193.1 UDP-N-acetylmuramoylalanyl-D-glutamyl-2,6-diamin opimelate/D-alanyl-D-alanyl ligase [Spirochaeta thermophila DSM 6578]
MSARTLPALSLDQLASIVGARLVAPSGERPPIRRVTIDSRECEEGVLFVPLRGRFTDGHLYLGEAFQRGASAALVQETVFSEAGSALLKHVVQTRGALLVVPDTLEALQTLGEWYLSSLRVPIRIGVTGSSGKTSTKEMLRAVLSLHYSRVWATEGNLNSEIGVPLSILGIREEPEVVICEMGIDHVGEMDVLARIVKPNLAVVTGIGSAHLERFGTRERIAREKAKIFSSFDDRSVGFIPEDEEFFHVLVEGWRGTFLPYGPATVEGFEGWESRGLEGVILLWKGLRIPLQGYGEHMVRNALGVIRLSDHLGVPPSMVAEGLQAYRPLFGRGELKEIGGVWFLVDCYNANPESMRASLEGVRGLKGVRRRIVVLGSMRELGDAAPSEHRRLGDYLAGYPADVVLLVGEEMEAAFAVLEGRSGVWWMRTVEEASSLLVSIVQEGDLVLLKGSRALGLERIIQDFEGRYHA